MISKILPNLLPVIFLSGQMFKEETSEAKKQLRRFEKTAEENISPLPQSVKKTVRKK